MQTPINADLVHIAPGYDPNKAHEYYMRMRKLHPRQKGAQPEPTGRTPKQPATKTRQKIELQNRISHLSDLLGNLEALIRKKEATLQHAQVQQKYKAKQNAKDKAKIKKQDMPESGSKKGAEQSVRKNSIAELKTLATKVKGQLAVAKQKLAAL